MKTFLPKVAREWDIPRNRFAARIGHSAISSVLYGLQASSAVPDMGEFMGRGDTW